MASKNHVDFLRIYNIALVKWIRNKVDKNNLFLVVLFWICSFSLHSQENFYETNSIHEVRINFKEKNWSKILDSLIQSGSGDKRLLGNVNIDGNLILNAGIRYKGFSSWNPNQRKNPFNIDLEYFVNNKNHQGFTKIKFSNAIHDPSFIREVLSYEIARKYMPASQSNYAKVFVNDTLIGLYANVEAVDKIFIAKHFQTCSNPFFKGNPAVLVFPFGENSNLAYSHGSDSISYMPFYKMESDYGWAELLNLIYILNNEIDSIENILNVDQTLWMHAFNYTFLNLDSYIGYSQNYYLYQDNNGRFNPILWDLNMSFGSFRNSDGSYNFQGLTIEKLSQLDPLGLLDFAITPRPLITQLLKKPDYQKMFMAHIRTIIKENISNGEYLNRGQELQALIDAQVKNDTNKFYSYNDFKNNLNIKVGGVGTMIEYPGIRDLMEARATFLKNYPGFYGHPIIDSVYHSPQRPQKNKEVWINAKINGAKKVIVSYRYNSTAVFEKEIMYDDGNHNDGLAGDGIYGIKLINTGNIIHYFVYAENDTAGIFSPERAATEYYTIYPIINQGELVINEVLVIKSNTAKSSNGIYSPWIELFNNTNEAINLKGLFLSDDKAIPNKWAFPDTSINAKCYFIVWADPSNQSICKTNFKLNDSGGQIILSHEDKGVMDLVIFGQQIAGKTIGRYPNGFGSFTYMKPSFSKHNYLEKIAFKGFIVFPNPTTNKIFVEITNHSQPVSIEILNTKGQTLRKHYVEYPNNLISAVCHEIDLSDFNSGIYLIKVVFEKFQQTQKFIVF